MNIFTDKLQIGSQVWSRYKQPPFHPFTLSRSQLKCFSHYYCVSIVLSYGFGSFQLDVSWFKFVSNMTIFLPLLLPLPFYFLFSFCSWFSSDASFSESLYGLRRRAVRIRVKKDNTLSDSSDVIHHSGLEKYQKRLSVLFLVQSTFIFYP